MNEGLLLWGLALLASALLLIIVEVFVPSGGVISLCATVVAIAGVVCLFRVSAIWGISGLLALMILGPLVGFFALNILPSTPMGRRLIHGDSPSTMAEDDPGADDLGPDGAPERLALNDPAVAALRRLYGAEGVAVTDLRMVGVIRIGEQKYAAKSELTLIRAGTPVRVTGVDGNELRVRPLA